MHYTLNFYNTFWSFCHLELCTLTVGHIIHPYIGQCLQWVYFLLSANRRRSLGWYS
jgi:hypothetical protein